MAKIKALRDGVGLIKELVKRLNRNREYIKKANTSKLRFLGFKRTRRGIAVYQAVADIGKAHEIIKNEKDIYDDVYKSLYVDAQGLIKSLKEMREKYGLKKQVSTDSRTADLFSFLLQLKRIREPFISVRNSLRTQLELTENLGKWNPAAFKQAYAMQTNGQNRIAGILKREYDIVTEAVKMRDSVKDIDATLEALREDGLESDLLFGVILRSLLYMLGGIIGVAMLSPEAEMSFSAIAARGPEMVKGVIGSVLTLSVVGAVITPAAVYLNEEKKLAKKREKILRRLSRIR